jgi:5S rRNA maturation endonuclease (ribonuclease M5)
VTLDQFLDQLEKVRPASGGYIACCPAHDDQEPSLSVRASDDRILISCKAGCSAEAVVEAMGLSFRDLFFNAVNFADPEHVYDYVDEEGALLFQALRFPGKKFRQRHTDPETQEVVWNLDGVRRVLYRLPEVIQAVSEGKTVYICEGEKDVEALRAIGKVATCNPMGAGKWRPEFAQYLSGAYVIIIADRDEPGRNHAEAVKQSLEGVAKTILIFQAKQGKDAFDHLVTNGLPVEEFAPMKSRVRRGIVTAHELAAQALEDLEQRETDNPGYWLLTPEELGVPAEPGLMFRKGRMYAFGAYRGEGKTSIAQQGTRRLCEAGLRGGYYSFEMSERDLRNRLLMHKGIPLKLLEEPWRLKANPEALALYHEGVSEIEGWNIDTIFDTSITPDKIAEVTRDREHDFVVIDHVHRFHWKERRQLEEMILALTNIALEQNVMVLVLSQLRKVQRGKDFIVYPKPTLDDFRETSQIADDASMALTVWRQRDATGVTYTGATEVAVLKNRHRTGAYDQAGKTFLPKFDADRGLFVPPGVAL